MSPGARSVSAATPTATRVAMGFFAILCAMTYGVLQSLDVVTLFSYLRANANLRLILKSCLIVNGVLFWSLWVASFLFSMISPIGFWGGNGTTDISDISGKSNPGLVRNLWVSVFDVMWVLPTYGLTQFLGIRWYSALYAEAYNEKKRRAAAAATASRLSEDSRRSDENGTSTESSTNGMGSSTLDSVAASISEILFKALVTAVYSVVTVLVEMTVPNMFGGPYIAFMMNSWLYALYVFDYRLSSQYLYDSKTRRQTRVSLFAALRLFERHWAYFLGFGVTQSIIVRTLRSSWFASSWFSVAAVTSVLYGAHVVLSVEAVPSPRASFSIPIFTPLFAVCGKVLRLIANIAF